MSTFFSGPDSEQLEDGAKDSPYYCSLIVNCAGIYTAKVAFVVNESKTYNFNNRKYNEVLGNVVVEPKLVEIECDITFQESESQKRIKEIEARYEPKFQALLDEQNAEKKQVYDTIENTISGRFDTRVKEVQEIKRKSQIVQAQPYTYSGGNIAVYSRPGYVQEHEANKIPIQNELFSRQEQMEFARSRKNEEILEEYLYKNRNNLTSVTKRPMDEYTASCYFYNVLKNNKNALRNYKENHIAKIDVECKKFLTMTLQERIKNSQLFGLHISSIYYAMFGSHEDIEKQISCYEWCLTILSQINDVYDMPGYSFGEDGYLYWMILLFEKEIEELNQRAVVKASREIKLDNRRDYTIY